MSQKLLDMLPGFSFNNHVNCGFINTILVTKFLVSWAFASAFVFAANLANLLGIQDSRGRRNAFGLPVAFDHVSLVHLLGPKLDVTRSATCGFVTQMIALHPSWDGTVGVSPSKPMRQVANEVHLPFPVATTVYTHGPQPTLRPHTRLNGPVLVDVRPELFNGVLFSSHTQSLSRMNLPINKGAE